MGIVIYAPFIHSTIFNKYRLSECKEQIALCCVSIRKLCCYCCFCPYYAGSQSLSTISKTNTGTFLCTRRKCTFSTADDRGVQRNGAVKSSELKRHAFCLCQKSSIATSDTYVEEKCTYICMCVTMGLWRVFW